MKNYYCVYHCVFCGSWRVQRLNVTQDEHSKKYEIKNNSFIIYNQRNKRTNLHD